MIKDIILDVCFRLEDKTINWAKEIIQEFQSLDKSSWVVEKCELVGCLCLPSNVDWGHV